MFPSFLSPLSVIITVSYTDSFSAKSCEMYPPPLNGALACNAWGVSNRYCAVSCNEQFDFAFPPALSYLCGNGIWTTIPPSPLPWPDCSGKWRLKILLTRVKGSLGSREGKGKKNARLFADFKPGVSGLTWCYSPDITDIWSDMML